MINKTNYKLQVTSYKLLAAYCRLLTACCGLLLTACCLLPTAAFAQCPNVTLTLTPTPSTCQSNGTIRVAVSGSDAGNIRLSDALYNITPIAPSSYSQPWATAAGGTLTNVPPGTYRVGLQAFCLTNSAWVEYNPAAATVTVTGNYVVPNVYFGTLRKTLSCIPSGMIPIVVQDGRAPYTITMTARPSAYTGPTTTTITSLSGTPPRATHNFDDLPAGTYTFSVTDNCSYNTVITTTVTTASADYSPNFVYTYLYVPTTVVQNDCRSVRVMLIDDLASSGNASHDAWPHYSDAANAAKYYEVALSPGTATAPTTGWVALTQYMNYTLPVDYNTFRAQNGRVAVWIRLKGASCGPPALLRTAMLSGRDNVSISYSNQTCTDFTLTHRLSLTTLYVFCYPYQWQITTGNGASTFVPWTSVSTTDDQIVHNVPYGARIEYRDACGQTWNYTLPQTDPLALITVFGPATNQYCISNSLPLTSSGILSSFLQVSILSGNFPMNTRIETIGWPAGGPAPNHPDITITTATASVYPYTPASNPVNIWSPYQATMPGTYTFRVSMPVCPSPRTITVTPTFHTATPMSYTSVAGCDGLTVFPTGQLGSITGSATSTLAGTDTWFFIQSWPAGVTVNTARVQAGGSLTLPASGTYVIGMARTATACASNTLTINYTKQQLSLNAAVTTAYVCPGGTTGFIRVQGTGGSGSYTYFLLSTNGATTYASNSAGTFSYGTAGQSFLVRVRDNVCNTSFEQPVTILNLNVSAIASTSSPNNEFCEGSTIQLLCANLGNTTYSWTGPGTWTSTQQNPTRPNATTAMSGTYTVTVRPEGCGTNMVQSVVVRVNPKPPLPNVPNTSLSLCRNTVSPTIAALTAASVTNSSYTLRFYNSSGATITGTTLVPTATATTLTYHITQHHAATGCESDRRTVTVTVHDLPAAPAVTPVSSACSGSLFPIIISPVTAGLYYKVYSASSGGTFLGQSGVGSGVIAGLTAPASSATWHVSAVNSANCESTRTAVSIPVTPTVVPSVTITAVPH